MQADEARELALAREFLGPYFDMLDALGPAVMNRTAHSERLAALLAHHALEARLAALKEAVGIALLTPFRAHAPDDVDFHSGCEQTRERIVAAIRSLAERASKGAGGSE